MSVIRMFSIFKALYKFVCWLLSFLYCYDCLFYLLLLLLTLLLPLLVNRLFVIVVAIVVVAGKLLL